MTGIYYSIIGFLALIILFITNYAFLSRKDNRKVVIEYKRYLSTVLFYYITDILWGIFDWLHDTQWLNYVTIAYYVATALTVLFCCRYVITFLDLGKTIWRALNILGISFCVVEFSFLIVNSYNPIFFSFDSTGTYHAELYRYAILLLPMLIFGALFLATLIKLHKPGDQRRVRVKAICVFSLIMTAAFVTQALFPLLPLYSMGLMLATMVIHVFIHEEEEIAQRKALAEACEAAEAANAAKTSFLFNMSHDIRTPMNAIIGFRSLLEKYQDDPARRADYLGKIESSSSVLLSIINNVLEMARIEKGTVVIDETAWSAPQFNDSLYSVFNEMMAQKGIDFVHELRVTHQYVYCDPTKLREIFYNILSNAYKYTCSGGRVSMLLEELPSEREDYVLYRTTISDTGIGMSEEFMPHLFEEFSREKNTTDNKIEGTGLGMSIVKRLVVLMHGTIDVSSQKGEGTTIVVTLPHRIADKSCLVDCADVEADPTLFKGKRILLAEDNDLNAEIAVELLSEVGFVVHRVENGREAVETLSKAEDNGYDLILMDVQMPEMNGYEATRIIRTMPDEAKARIPILAMTANAFAEDRRAALDAGMNDHLAKPINMRQLMRALAHVLS